MRTLAERVDRSNERGVALLLVVMALLLVSTLIAGLTLEASTEIAIAGNHRKAVAGLYAADAALARALVDLTAASDPDGVLAGSLRSDFADGPPDGARHLADGSTIDLAGVRNRMTCGIPSGCSEADRTEVTADRPWGANNPVWRLYAYGPLSGLGADVRSPFYVVVLVGDDPAETDGDPLHDGASPSNPGSGLLSVRALAFGAAGVQQAVDATISVTSGARLRSWRTVAP